MLKIVLSIYPSKTKEKNHVDVRIKPDTDLNYNKATSGEKTIYRMLYENTRDYLDNIFKENGGN